MHRPESGDGINKITNEAIYFYTPEFYALDNFSAYIIDIWGHLFATSEHAFQWKKFENVRPDIAAQIIHATSAGQSKKLAIENKANRRKDWDDIKIGVMEEILRAKVTQHEKVRRVLMETGERMIYENSPEDDFWGIGKDGTGKNHLGVLWMKLRDELA